MMKKNNKIVNKAGKGVSALPLLAGLALTLVTAVGFSSVYSKADAALAFAKPDERRAMSLIDREDDNMEVDDFAASAYEGYGKVFTSDGECIYSPVISEGGQAYTNLIGKIGIKNDRYLSYMYRDDLYNNYNWFNGLRHPAPELTITINGELQKHMTEYLESTNVDGTVLCSDIHTGEILCMVSTPAAENVEDNSREGGLMNKNLYTTVPGSTIKVLTTLLLEMEGIDTSELVYPCGGTALLPDGNVVTCEDDHGPAVTIEGALGNSCNCFFAHAIQNLDWALVTENLKRLGFVVNSPEAVQRQIGKLVYRTSEVTLTGRDDFNSIYGLIGQGKTLVSPLDMLRLTALLATDGEGADPFLVYGDSGMEPLLLTDEEKAMFSKVNTIWKNAYADYYIARNVYPEGLLAAKTGTAQIGGKAQKKLLSGYTEDGIAFYIVINNHIDTNGIKISVTPIDILENLMKEVKNFR